MPRLLPGYTRCGDFLGWWAASHPSRGIPGFYLEKGTHTSFAWMQNPSQACLHLQHLSLHMDLSRPTRFAELSFSSPRSQNQAAYLAQRDRATARVVSLLSSSPRDSQLQAEPGTVARMHHSYFYHLLAAPGMCKGKEAEKVHLGPGRRIQGLRGACAPRPHIAQGCPLPLGRLKEVQELELSSMAIIKSN